MDIETIEDEIVDRIKAKLTDTIDNDVEVIPLPESDTEILPAYGKRKIIVAFNGDDAQPDGNLSVVQQDTDTTFAIAFFGKLTRGEKGIYALKRKVTSALIGFTPTDCQKLTYGSFKFVENKEKVFNYVLLVKTVGVIVEEPDDQQALPAFTKLTIQDQ